METTRRTLLRCAAWFLGFETPSANAATSGVLFYLEAAPLSASPGGTVTFTVRYRNRRKDRLQHISISSDLPAQLLPVSVSREPFSGAKGNLTGQRVSWQIHSLPGSPVFAVTFEARVVAHDASKPFITTCAQFSSDAESVTSNSVDIEVVSPQH